MFRILGKPVIFQVPAVVALQQLVEPEFRFREPQAQELLQLKQVQHWFGRTRIRGKTGLPAQRLFRIGGKIS
jgi:hypothetical protein